MKSQETLESIDKWLDMEMGKVLAAHSRKLRSLRIRQGMARKKSVNKPFQTPARDIA